MARQPKQVHIFLYRQRDGRYEYAVFQRSDMPCCWQGVCGGAEGSETLEEAARRELMEEAGITEPLPLYQQENMHYLQADIFSEAARAVWGKDVVLVPQYYFAMPYDGEIILSEEHTTVRWLPYDKAYNLVYFTEQKTALYELNEKLLRGLM